MPLPLFDERVHREGPRRGPQSPEYFVYWKCVRYGYEGQSFTYRDEDETLMQYAKDGYRLGKLLSTLPCMKERK